MIETIKKEWQAQAGIVIFVLLAIWWFLSPNFQGPNNARFLGDFPSIYAVLALWGAIWGMSMSKNWGGIKSVLGKALIMFSLGLVAQVFGQVTFWYFVFYKNIAVPYPSLADIGYFGCIPLYIYGVLLLAKASGVKIKLLTFGKQIQAVLIPLAMLVIGYVLFLKGYTIDLQAPLKTLLDLGYPLGDAMYISFAILTYFLSKGVLGGIMKSKILFILLALLIQFLADWTFLYQSSRGTYISGGITDFMYLTAYFAMTLGLIQFLTVYKKLNGK